MSSMRSNIKQTLHLIAIPGVLRDSQSHLQALEDWRNAKAPLNVFHFGPTAVTDCKNRPVLGLTQAYCQLRTEFLPIYYATVHVALYLLDLPAYTSTFLETYAMGNVHVKYLDYEERFDIRSALVLHGTVPGVTIDFGVETRDLTPVSWNVSKYTKFLAFVAERTYEVIPLLARWYGGRGNAEYVEPLGLAVHMKREMGEDWMDDPYQRGIDACREGLGLPSYVMVWPEVDRPENKS
ncbi:hypothetical protein E8E11_005671 [Didymella keratinophila]|nr:hypothetical protein E8E11_005671 [Didymella keratinophila]